MKRKEVLCRFCALSTEVADCVLGHLVAHDCFCGEGGHPKGFQFDEQIVAFIEKATRTAIAIDEEDK